MGDGAETGKRSGRPPWAWFIVPGFVLLYVLSIGPAAAIWPRAAPKAVKVFYAPLIWLVEETPARGPLLWYLDLWD